MTANAGTTDRILRAALGAVLLYRALLSELPFFAATLFSYGAMAAGVIMLATSVLEMCPVYSVLGTKTCKGC